MFSDKYQGSLNSIYYSIGSNPLAKWDIQCKEGDLRTVQDDELISNVLQIVSKNVAACMITTPVCPRESLGIRLPFISFLIKNIDRYFTFEITILDNDNFRRRIRMSNYQRTTRTSTYMCSMPMCLSEGWSQVHLDLAKFTKRAFNTAYMETVRVQIHANCRLRRVFFSDKEYKEHELPNEYRLHRSKSKRSRPIRIIA